MKRRDFIKLGAAGLAAAALLAIGFAPRPRFVVRHQVRARLGEWSMEDADLDAFLAAFEKHWGTPAPDRDEFVEILILSTNAFSTDRKPGDRQLRFVRLYHPYANACHNPLARL